MGPPGWEGAPLLVHRLSDPARAGEVLRSLPGWPVEPPFQVHAVTRVRAHPGSRWALRLTTSAEGQDWALFAKVYARERPDIARTLTAVRRGGLDGPHAVPAPLLYVPGWRLLLLEEAPGTPARDLLRRGEPGVGVRVAGWLAAFHTAALPLPAAYRMRDPLVQAGRWSWRLGESAPRLKASGQHLLGRLEAARPAWPPPVPRLIHGDFVTAHVLLNGEQATVIDWDAWEVGDPAQDAGRFLASLRHLAVREPTLAGRASAEADAFASRYGELVPSAGRALPFYEALACLRKAARRAVGGNARRQEHAAWLLEAAWRCVG